MLSTLFTPNVREHRFVTDQIEKAISVLVGKNLWRCTRAADLAAFQFGERIPSKTYKGEACEVGEFALHVQCSWRIVQHEKVIVAHRDLYYPAGYHSQSEAIPRDFYWDAQGANRQDRLIHDFFQNGSRAYMVQRVEAGNAGAFLLALADDFSLEVFPDDSLEGEHWRLFTPGGEGPHFVVTGTGIEFH